MRDESVSPNVAKQAEERGSVFVEIKHAFLSNRTEESALATFEKLLAMESDNTDE